MFLDPPWHEYFHIGDDGLTDFLGASGFLLSSRSFLFSTFFKDSYLCFNCF
jgi:hypothetical protein